MYGCYREPKYDDSLVSYGSIFILRTGRSILSDGLFDGLAKRMLECWDDIDHWHKDLITTGDLEAGTLLARDFPERVKGAVKHLRSNK